MKMAPAPRACSTFQHTGHPIGHALLDAVAAEDRFALSEEPRDVPNEGHIPASPRPPDLNRQPKQPVNQRFNLSRPGRHLADFRADQTDVRLFRELGEKCWIPCEHQALELLQCLEHLVSY